MGSLKTSLLAIPKGNIRIICLMMETKVTKEQKSRYRSQSNTSCALSDKPAIAYTA